MKLARYWAQTLSFVALLISAPFASASDIELVEKKGVDAEIIRRITLNPQIANASVGTMINFELPGSKKDLTFKVDSVKDAYQGSKVITGFSGNGTSLLLTMDDNASFGSIQGKDVNYSISHSNESGQFLVDHNSASFPNIDLSNDAVVPPGLSKDKPGYLQMGYDAKILEQRNAKGNSVVTIMVLYSSEFSNGFASPSARINQLIAFSNQSYARSGINIDLKLAHAQEISFNNNEGIGTLLGQIRTGAGSFSGVSALRNKYGADMVALLPFRSGNGSAGIAYVNGGSPNYAFSVTQLSPNCCDSVFAHELGHNLGSGHERLSSNPNQPDPCDEFSFVSYACGHGNHNNGWGTIMSYLNSGAVNHVFSNPGLTCQGEPCGIAAGSANSADNKSAFNISGPLVAAFRADPTPPPPTPPTGNTSSTVPVLNLLLDDDD